MQCCDTHFTIPFLLLGRVTLPCAGHYQVGISMTHLKMSSVLCSSTRFVFPLRSNSCKALGSASGIRISVKSLQLKSTNYGIKKKKAQLQRKYSLFCHVVSYSSAPSKHRMTPPLIVSHKQFMKMALTYW